MTSSPDNPDAAGTTAPKPSAARAAREARLAKALRDNLRRRKSAARQTGQEPSGPE